MNTTIKTGHSSYGFCYVEQVGTYFYVHVGSSTYGPYSNATDALNEFRRWCA